MNPLPGLDTERTISALERAFVVVLLLLVAVIGFGVWRYLSLSTRLDKANTVVERQAQVLDRQATALASVERLAKAFARLSSTDPAERAAAREELAQLARGAAASRQQSPTTTRPSAPPTTRPPSGPQASPAAPTTTAAPVTTTTTRACVHVVALEVCRR